MESIYLEARGRARSEFPAARSEVSEMYRALAIHYNWRARFKDFDACRLARAVASVDRMVE